MVAKALGVELNLKKVDLFNKEQLKPEFIAINPEHTVPTLVDGDFVLWESKAIIGYLVAQYGKNDSLYPSDPKKRAMVDRFLFYDTALHEIFRGWAHPVMKENAQPEEAKKEKLHDAIEKLEQHLKRSGAQFVTGDSLCVADFTLACAITTYRELGVDMTRHPLVEAWLQRCAEVMPGYEEICLAGAKLMAAAVKDKLNKRT
ncbi:Glutathione S-transferase N-terminal [Trinorchestia longiramus]|nr:Glutathione S-transferase N-terminal [Trinorchestia longiramus]